jgi:hypothetical protein
MKTALVAVAVFVAMCSVPRWITAGDGPGDRMYTPGEVETLFLGKGKRDIIAVAGAPDTMYGVMGEEGVPVNFSAHWEYRPPKMKIVDPGTGKSPATLHIWFDPNDRVERVTLDFAR